MTELQVPSTDLREGVRQCFIRAYLTGNTDITYRSPISTMSLVVTDIEIANTVATAATVVVAYTYPDLMQFWCGNVQNVPPIWASWNGYVVIPPAKSLVIANNVGGSSAFYVTASGYLAPTYNFVGS